jgi:hypothetical protein
VKTEEPSKGGGESERKIDEFEINTENGNIRDLYRGINEFKMVTNL